MDCVERNMFVVVQNILKKMFGNIHKTDLYPEAEVLTSGFIGSK